MQRLERMSATRIVAKPVTLDALKIPIDVIALRLAQDELLLLGEGIEALGVSSAEIVEPESGFAGVWLSTGEANELFARHCEWVLPRERPAFAQGMIGGIAAKVWLEAERVLILVPAPFAHEFENNCLSVGIP